MINKLPKHLVEDEFDSVKSAVLRFDKLNKTQILQLIHKRKRQLYEFVCSKKHYKFITLKASELPLKFSMLEHPLRPSASYFKVLFNSETNKKYLESFDLFNTLLQAATICVKAMKDENELLKSFATTNLKCLTRDLYKEANISVFCYDTEKFLHNKTPVFYDLPKVIQEDITKIEIIDMRNHLNKLLEKGGK